MASDEAASKVQVAPPGKMRKPLPEKEARPATVAGNYVPTEAERGSMKEWSKLMREHPPLPEMKVETNGEKVSVGPDHQDSAMGMALQMAAIATAYPVFYDGTLRAIANLSNVEGKTNVDRISYLIAMVAGIKPRDQLESMLAVQMAAIHDATLEMAVRMKRVDTIQQHDSAERSLNKLARTFATQMEALKHYRSKGEQRVYVERVTVNDGGQAIVGPVSHGGGGDEK